MTGLLLLLLSVFLPQQALAQIGTNSLPGVNGVTKGWVPDPTNNSLNYIVQISPQTIRAFAEGQSGQDLTVAVEQELIGQIGSISIRIGTAPLTQNPSLAGFQRNQVRKQPSIQQLHMVRYPPQPPVLPMPTQEKTGWADDLQTNRFAFLVQFSPDTLGTFVVDGNELNFPIEESVRPYVEQFTIRIGTGLLPRQAPRASTMRTNDLKSIDLIATNGQPNLASMNGRGLSSVMPPANEMSGASVMPGASVMSGASVMPGASVMSGASVMPDQRDFDSSRMGTNGLGQRGPDNRLTSGPSTGVPFGSQQPMANLPMESPTIANTLRATSQDINIPANGSTNNGSRALNSMLSKITNGGANQSDPRNQYADSMGQYRNPGYNAPAYPSNQAPPIYASTPSVDYPRIASTNPGGSNQLPLGGTTSTGFQTNNQPTPIPIGIPQATGASLQAERLDLESRGLQRGLIFLSFFLFAICLFQFIYMTGTRAKYRKLVLSKRHTLLESSH